MAERVAKRVSVRGVVQGVGFRPFVYRLAQDHGLTGWVLNHSGGVEITVEGSPQALTAFLQDLQAQAPPQARIEGLHVADAPLNGYTTFEIRHSVAEAGRYLLISPDIATCPDCLRELFDPADRRYRYPFTNCTNCGPRFTIIADIPYDRPLTTMRDFVMCPQCQAEYDNPLDRRFHAQPNACPACGPKVWWRPSPRLGDPAESPQGEAALAAAREALLDGAIVAIKGLGGFHLACDATNESAVRALRQRKARPDKPLAVMIATLDEVRRHCRVSPDEERLLTSSACPIVLLPWLSGSDICPLVAPRNRYLGVMLPYTPLHHILLRDVGRPLVMTSGNLSEEPIASDNDEALRRLARLADFFLLHNRDIYSRYDDSVWFVPGTPQPIRRARGYAPFPVKLPFAMRQVLACGAELKNTFCLTRDEYAFISQHIGDMENLETLEHFEATVALYRRLFRIEPEIVAYDLHPDYLATRYALAQPVETKVGVQHHHAHIAACLADNGWRPEDGPVIGVAWDGTGYGSDGHLWGGEFLVGDYFGFRRAAHLEYLPMPGGEAAIREPYRLALGYLRALGEDLPVPPMPGVEPEVWEVLCQQVERHINCPLTSAGGRLFDAVSALLGVCTHTTYEGQAAVELEMAAGEVVGGPQSVVEPGADGAVSPYPFGVDETPAGMVLRLRPLFAALLEDMRAGREVGEMAYRFHLTTADMIASVCSRLAEQEGLRTVALSGGCFQNRLLLALTVPRLEGAGLRVLVHRQVPCNDGGLSLGQAVMGFWTADHATRKARKARKTRKARNR